MLSASSMLIVIAPSPPPPAPPPLRERGEQESASFRKPPSPPRAQLPEERFRKPLSPWERGLGVRSPPLCQIGGQHIAQLGDVNEALLHRVAVADGHLLIFQAVEVYGDTVGRADLVLAAIALADAAARIIILRQAEWAQAIVYLMRQRLQFVLLRERHHGDLHGRQPLVQPQHHARLLLD